MKVAIVPFDYENNKADKMFKRKEIEYAPFRKMYTCFQEIGIEVHTIDVYDSLRNIDWIYFFALNTKWYTSLIWKKCENKMVYVAFEPETVIPFHSDAGIRLMCSYFKYILTWNIEQKKEGKVFLFQVPYFYRKGGEREFGKRKLLVNISGNKYSDCKKELYSERRKVIEYYDGSTDFALYGTGWDKEKYKSYKGRIKDKFDVYSDYKFALCLENQRDTSGYVTEKILDCFCGGTVPVYLGAVNIADYIPQECFVNYAGFSSMEELDSFLRGMTEKEWNGYMQNINRWLEREDKPFTVENFVKSMVRVMEYDRENDYNFCLEHRIKVLCRSFFTGLRNKIRVIYKICQRKLRF